MTRVLVTGGRGMLGRVLVPKLVEAGYVVRVGSRQARPSTMLRSAQDASNVEWAQMDVLTGEGVAEAVRDVDVVVHGATSPGENLYAVEVEGTRHVLEAARAAGVGHFIYVSIVGIDRTPYEYYTAKVGAEEAVRGVRYRGRICGGRSFLS